MDLIKLESIDPHWTEFLKTHEHQIFHRPEYKQFIEETFSNSKAYYFAVINNEKIEMLFPLIYVDQPIIRKIFFTPFFDIFKPKLISAGFHDFGGPIGNVKSEYMIKIFNYIKFRFHDVNHIEIKDNHPVFNKLIKRREYHKFIIPLTNREETWQNIQKYKRKAIKKAKREKIITREIHESEINDLYNLYLDNMKRFGELPYSKKYFINFYQYFIKNGLGKCFGSYYNNKLISALIGFCVNKKIHVIIAVSDNKYLNLRPNDAVHWKFIEWGINNNYNEFDFGRTRPESGQYEYKRKWGGKIIELETSYLPLKNKPIPTIDPTNPKYKIFLKIEQNLPLIVTKHISSWFREGLGI